MQSPFSLLSPFVVYAASTGFIVLIVASISLIRDLMPRFLIVSSYVEKHRRHRRRRT
jgi:hypothetical protein